MASTIMKKTLINTVSLDTDLHGLTLFLISSSVTSVFSWFDKLTILSNVEGVAKKLCG